MVKRRTTGTTESQQPVKIYQLHVELREIEPKIWRRLLVPSSITLAKLHQVLQIAFAWTDSHLHQFAIAGQHYGIPDDDWPAMSPLDDRDVTLTSCIGASVSSFVYEYDFGDGWAHAIRVERITAFDDVHCYPLCIGGANACPPEDVGGVGGYAEFLNALAHAEHPEHENYLRWCGGYFDRAGFDANAVNTRLRRIRVRSRR